MTLSDHQIKVVQRMIEITESYANQLLHIMQNHGLDKIDGCSMSIDVRPGQRFVNRSITFGTPSSDAGFIRLTRGDFNEEYEPLGTNSAEFELLFASKKVRSRMESIRNKEKPLPPDGLWIGDPVYCSSVDGWWDVNEDPS